MEFSTLILQIIWCFQVQRHNYITFINIPATPTAIKDMCNRHIFCWIVPQRNGEERQEQKEMSCLLPDHVAAKCTNTVICLSCFRSGHQHWSRTSHFHFSGTRNALPPPPPPPHPPRGNLRNCLPWPNYLALIQKPSTLQVQERPKILAV